MLEVRNLSINYGAIEAVQDVTFAVPAGQIVSIIGANGAGKTTTLSALSGLLRPRAGQILFDGADITRWMRAPGVVADRPVMVGAAILLALLLIRAFFPRRRPATDCGCGSEAPGGT